ncbi:putative F-box/kelch-repeat protein At5g24040 [Brassica napus]|uniref:putative F-box/kelch-repeat protein At5g24040 n=1 Tax=Brassica napus TaxID=3708 RepID=UPI002078C2DA|nr:putative F-box/kelch-repeat protein At5g24040 [Brassica napus]
MEKWSELPPEILHSISLRIDNSFDLIHFRSVCSSWRSSSILFRPKTSLRCPLLVYSSGYGDDRYILSRSVYLLKSSDLNGPRYWLFKLQEKENGDIVLHSFVTTRPLGTTCPVGPRLTALQRTDPNPSIMSSH